MKKLVALFLMLALMLGLSAMAEDLGVQVIGGPDVTAVADNLDDMKLESTYTIDGFARVTPKVYEFRDMFWEYAKDKAGDNSTNSNNDENHPFAYRWGGSNYRYVNVNANRSGKDAQYAWIEMDVTNLAKAGVDFTKIAAVKVFFDEEYEFAGWVRMQNYNYDVTNDNKELIRATINPANAQETAMMYTTHMVFGCTLPNAVVEGTEPLRMEITLGDSVLTYHIRK